MGSALSNVGGMFGVSKFFPQRGVALVKAGYRVGTPQAGDSKGGAGDDDEDDRIQVQRSMTEPRHKGKTHGGFGAGLNKFVSSMVGSKPTHNKNKIAPHDVMIDAPVTVDTGNGAADPASVVSPASSGPDLSPVGE